MDLGKKLHMSLDDLIKTQSAVQKKDKASEKPGAKGVKTTKAKKSKQDSAAKLKMKAEPRKKLITPKARVEPSTGRGGKRGQSSGGKRGLNSAVRVRFAPKIMSQATQRHTAQETAHQASSLANLVSNLNLATKRDAQKALKVARQLEAMAQEKLGTQQQAPSRTVNNARYQRTALPVEEPARRHVSQRGTIRRSTQRNSPPEEPVHPLHDPSRYDHGYDEYVEDEMEEEDVKPSIAAMNQLNRRRAGY